MSVKEIMLSPIGLFFVLLIKTLLGGLFICSGVQLLNFKNINPFFTLKKIIGMFLLILGLRFLIDVLFVFKLA